MTINSPTKAESPTPELCPPPRPVQTNLRAHILRVFMITLTVAIPVFLFALARYERARLDRLQAEGKQTPGTVISKSTRKSNHTLRYQYRVDAKTYSGSESVGSDEYASKPVNSTVTITYLPADPQVHQYGTVRPGDGAASQRNRMLLGLLVAAILIVADVAVERNIRRDRRLCELGIAVEGTVTKQSGGKHPKTHYTYTPRYGQPLSGAAQATSATRRLAVGESLTVLYDPEDPSISKPYKGISMARVAM